MICVPFLSISNRSNRSAPWRMAAAVHSALAFVRVRGVSKHYTRTCSAVGPAGADGRSCRGRVLGHGAGAAANHELLAHHVDPTVSAAAPSVLLLCTSRPLLTSIGGATTCCTSDAAIAPGGVGQCTKGCGKCLRDWRTALSSLEIYTIRRNPIHDPQIVRTKLRSVSLVCALDTSSFV